MDLLKNINPSTECILSVDKDGKFISFIETYDFYKIKSDEIINKFMFESYANRNDLTFFQIFKKENHAEKIIEMKTEILQLKIANQQIMTENNNIKNKMKNLTELFGKIIL